MRAEDFARLVRGRRVGKGKWMGYCSAHPDRNRSLAIAEGKKGILVKCMSVGCDTRDILACVGLSYKDLFYTSRTVASDQLKAIYKQQYVDRLYVREQRLQDLRMVLRCIEIPPHRRLQRTESRFERDIVLALAKLESSLLCVGK